MRDVKTQKPSPALEDFVAEVDAWFAMGGLTRGRHRNPRRNARAPSTVSATRTGKASLARRTTNAPESSVLRLPEWKQYGWLIHGFSTRFGGVSTAYGADANCGEMNLGFTAADSRQNVERNRELFLKAVMEPDAVGGREKTIEAVERNSSQRLRPSLHVFKQIHSGLVHHVASNSQADGSLRRGDGVIASGPGALLGIQTADCIPVLVADVRLRVVAAFHAGWRGTLARIVERGVGRMRAEFGSRPENLTAAIGPGIGCCCYSVGEEVRAEFESQFVYADALFEEVFDLDPVKEKYPMLFLTARAPGHSDLGPNLHLDLAEANRRQLIDAGLQPEAVHVLGLCTSCDTQQFFSHRAEHGFTGRMLSVIGVVEKEGCA
jgi:polyphenol oxidase